MVRNTDRYHQRPPRTDEGALKHKCDKILFKFLKISATFFFSFNKR